MTHVIVDDQFPDHPKVIGLSDAAIAAWLRGLCYASRYMTDGFIAAQVQKKVGTKRACDQLVAAGLWDEADGGWQIHDYRIMQRTNADLDQIAKEKGKAGTLGNHKRWHLARNIVSEDCKWCIADGSQVRPEWVSQNDRKPSPETETETETETEPEREPAIDLSDGYASGVPATRDPRAVAAAEVLGIRDFDRAKSSKDDIVVDDAYRRKCIATRQIDVPALDALAEQYPTFTPHALADQLEDLRAYGGAA